MLLIANCIPKSLVINYSNHLEVSKSQRLLKSQLLVDNSSSSLVMQNIQDTDHEK